MKGRPPKSIEYHRQTKPKLYGDLAERDDIEPEAVVVYAVECPKHLNRSQRREWHDLAEVLSVYNLLVPANALIMERLAVNLAEYKKALKVVNDKGIIIKSPQGFPIYNPFWTAQNKLEDKIHRDLVELGLSATGLARLGSLMVKSKKQKDEMEELLG